MRKGYRREAGSEGSAKQRCEPMNKNRIGGASAGRAGDVSRSPYPSTARSVDPAAVHRRRLSLPRKICRVSPLRRLRRPRGPLTARQKSAEGVVCAGQRPDREGSSPSGARMRSAVSKGGGNASLAEARGRYGAAGTQAKAGDGQGEPGATAQGASEDRVSAVRRDPKGMRRSTGP